MVWVSACSSLEYALDRRSHRLLAPPCRFISNSEEDPSSATAAPWAADAPQVLLSSVADATAPRQGELSARGRGTATSTHDKVPTNDARRPKFTTASRRSHPTKRLTEDGNAGDADQNDNYHGPQDWSGAETVAATGSGTRSLAKTNNPDKANTELEGVTGVTAAELAVAGSRNDAESNKVTRVTGKPKLARNETASGVDSAAVAVGKRNGAPGAGTANVGWAPGISLKARGEDAPYTEDESNIIINCLYSRNGLKLDVDHCNSVLAKSTLELEKAREEGAATAESSKARNEINDNEGSSSTGTNGKGKRKSPGGGRPAVKGSVGAAKDEKKEKAAGSTPSTPVAISKAPGRQRKLKIPAGEEGIFLWGNSDATVNPNKDGYTPSGANRRGPADAHGPGVEGEPPQQSANRRKKVIISATPASNVVGKSLKRGAGCGGDGARDPKCGGKDCAGVEGKPTQQSGANHRKKVRTSTTPASNVVSKSLKRGAGCDGDGARDSRCGGKGSDGDMAPFLPLRPLSARQKGASKPILERARVNKCFPMRKYIPISAAGVGSETSFIIPKKAARSEAQSKATAGSGGSGVRMSNTGVPTKNTTKPKKSW